MDALVGDGGESAMKKVKKNWVSEEKTYASVCLQELFYLQYIVQTIYILNEKELVLILQRHIQKELFLLAALSLFKWIYSIGEKKA